MYPSLYNYLVLPAVFNNYHMAALSLYYGDFKPLSLIGTGQIYATLGPNTSRNYVFPDPRNSYGCGTNDKKYKCRRYKKYLNLHRFSSMKRRVSKDNDDSGCTDGYQPPTKRQQLQPRIKPALISEYQALSKEIDSTYLSSQQTNDIYLKKMRLCSAIRVILQDVYSGCYLFVVGSSMNGFGTKTSDMDMCLVLHPNEIDQRIEALSHLRNVRRALQQCGYIQKLELISAKVPILKFRDRISGVEVDLNVNNTVGIRNTHLLRCYSKVDQRIAPLVGIVKIWARIQNINDAKCMTISSYSLTLMVIHYLQCGVSPPILPSLQKLYPDKFSNRVAFHTISMDDDDDVPVSGSKNNMNLGELLIGFLDYFTNRYDFEKDAMSIRIGMKVPKMIVQHQKSKKNNPGQWKCLCIEEPFDLTNTARSVYDDEVFSRVKSVFQSSLTRLRDSKELNSILKR